VPQQVLGEQVVESGEIALGEGGVPVPDASDIRMLGHVFPLPVCRWAKAAPQIRVVDVMPPRQSPTYGVLAILGRAEPAVKTPRWFISTDTGL
jgi:hypothetical protein